MSRTFRTIKTSLNENIGGNGPVELHLAAIDNDLSELEQLLSQGADVESRDIYSRTALHLAVKNNDGESHFKVVEALLKNGADVNARDNQGCTPLYYLVQKASIRFVQFFLNSKGDFNAVSNRGRNLIFSVCSIENLKILQLLIDLGLNVNHRSVGGQTPLHLACQLSNDNIRTIKCLLENGANMDEFDDKDYSPGIEAIYVFGRSNIKPEEIVKKFKFLIAHTDFQVILEDVNVFNFYNDKLLPDYLWEWVLEHFAKLRALNIPVASHLLETISKDKLYNSYYEECQQELLLAKNTKLKNSWLTFYNLLEDGKRKLKNYAGNSDLIEGFEKSDVKKNFPIYGAEMVDNVKKGIKKRKLFDKSCLLLSDCLPIFNFNHLIISGILDCIIGKKDLSKFCE